jgi:hypothetical protein
MDPAAMAAKTRTSKRMEAWMSPVLAHLARWQDDVALHDRPLPELYAVGRRSKPRLTIGQFHDGLRTLHERKQIYLHPWSGPLSEIPEPALALLVGHEIAYYASVRIAECGLRNAVLEAKDQSAICDPQSAIG